MIARVADGELAAALLVGLVRHHVVRVGRVVPDAETGFYLGRARAREAERGSDDASADEQLLQTHHLILGRTRRPEKTELSIPNPLQCCNERRSSAMPLSLRSVTG